MKTFESTAIGSLQLKNRLVRSATAENMATDDGYPLPQYFDMYRELARGGVGLIITGHLYVHPQGKCHNQMTAIHDDSFIPGLKILCDGVHQSGSKIVAQINHGGMHSNGDGVSQPLSPSVMEPPISKKITRELNEAEIHEIITAFGEAARRAEEAGFDGVQIHGAHGYLNSQFLSPYLNKRTDEWGGSPEKRRRFLFEVIKSIRSRVSSDFPVLIKLGVVDGVEGGLTLSESIETIRLLKETGINAIEISSALGKGEVKTIQKGIKPGKDEGYFKPWSEEIRKATNLPLILVGGFRSLEFIEATLQEGYVDFISMCRPLICEPDLPRRFENGLQKYSICISANNCFAKEKGQFTACRCPIDRTLRNNQ